MKIGFIGLGKLGLPCALSIEQKGHTVFGFDPSPITKSVIENKKLCYLEENAQSALDSSNICLVDMQYLTKEADVIFIAVQTPHDSRFEGVCPINDERADFDYTFLCQAITALTEEIKQQQIEKHVVVISTVLPGTMESYVRPILEPVKDLFHLVYNPFFIAMGTTMHDFCNPEFVLCGSDNPASASKLKEFYSTIHSRPVFETTIENAELTKVLYNTFIGMKIVFANTVMELCHKTPNTNCDSIISALSLANERLLSPKYLRGGMGDGGGCHPRDNIALSWLSRKLNLSHDFFEDIMVAREDQTKWLMDLIKQEANDLPIVLMGLSFKPNTNITVGSPARLLSYYLTEENITHTVYDPIVDPNSKISDGSSLFFISTQHEMWKTYIFPKGSTVIDPFRYLQDNKTILTYIPIGGGTIKFRGKFQEAVK